MRDRPDLLASHFNAYLQIAQDELAATRRQLVQQIAWVVITAVLVLAAILFFGFAAMLAATGLAPADLRLFAVPIITVIAALVAWVMNRTSKAPAARSPGSRLADHLRQDVELLKQLG
jgi:uncharacterized membrane protein YedE/YeeE